MAHSLALNELTDPFPAGVVQSVPVLAWKPEASPFPLSSATVGLADELERSDGVLTSNDHRLISIALLERIPAVSEKAKKNLSLIFQIVRWVHVLLAMKAPTLLTRRILIMFAKLNALASNKTDRWNNHIAASS